MIPLQVLRMRRALARAAQRSQTPSSKRGPKKETFLETHLHGLASRARRCYNSRWALVELPR
eukprot:8240135-Pyramimonas_sp.AAC.1